jgi:hypothetical protein
MCCGYKQTGKGTSGFDCLMIPGASKAASNPGTLVPQTVCGRSQGLVTSAAGTTATTICCKACLHEQLNFCRETSRDVAQNN